MANVAETCGTYLTEWLDSFILLGLDADGNIIEVTHAPTGGGAAALDTLLQRAAGTISCTDDILSTLDDGTEDILQGE